MAAAYNDGTVQYGSRSWVIHSSLGPPAVERGTYVADNIAVDRPTKAIDRTNELGEPSGSVGVSDFVTGSCTIQLADDSAVEPRAGDLIVCDGEIGYNANLDATGGIGDESFFITSVSRQEAKDGERKLSLTFKKKYGA